MKQARANRRHTKKAEGYEKARKFADAVDSFKDAQKAAKTKMEDYDAWMGVARCEHALKRFAEAIKAYEAALKAVPNDAKGRALLKA